MIKDIEGRDIEPGDLVLRPSYSNLVKAYALYYTKSGNLIMSCKRIKSSYCKSYIIDRRAYSYPEEHDSKQQCSWPWGEMYIIKKYCEIPEALKKYIRNG